MAKTSNLDTENKEASTAIGTLALKRMQAMFTPERWGRLERQALTVRGLDAAALQALCASMVATRSARYPDNPAAADAAAANGLLLALGSSLRPEDCQRLDDAVKGISAPAAAAPAADPQVPAVTAS